MFAHLNTGWEQSQLLHIFMKGVENMQVVDMKRNNYIVYFETESELFEEMEAFEQYLIQRGLKPFLRIGRVNREKLYFTFTITTPEHEEKEEVLAFFNKQTITQQYLSLIHIWRCRR